LKCEHCNEREATVHYTEIEKNEKKEIHLCEECYRQKFMPVHKIANFTEILQNFLHGTFPEGASTAGAICPTCGISMAEFRAGGRLGCPNDYHVFGDALKPLLEKIQHDTGHVGKVPRHAGAKLKRKNQLIRFRRDLERAVQREEYEEAAHLRDQIRQLSEDDDGPA